MKRFFPYGIVLIGLIILTSSCYLAGTMETEVLQPAKVAFPSEVYRVGAISRMDLEVKRSYGKIDDEDMAIFNRDSALLKNAVLGLLDGLAESPRFEAYEVKPTRVLEGHNTSLNEDISWAIIEDMSRKDSLDMIISLTSATFTDTTKYVWNEMTYVLYLKSYWRTYDLTQRKVGQYLFQDTLNFRPGAGRDGYPSRNQVIKNFEHSLGIAGYQFSRRMAPFWELEERIWFPDGDYLFQKASDFAKEGNWIEASAIWSELAYSKSRNKAAKASYNMAVAAEMNDKLDLALEWLEHAKELGDNYYADYYIEIIKERQATQKLLDNQMK